MPVYNITITANMRSLLMTVLSDLDAATLRQMNPDAADPTEARDLLLVELHVADADSEPAWPASEVVELARRLPHLTRTEIARRTGWSVFDLEPLLYA